MLPGDIVKISADTPVPADCILMRGTVLMDESMLTGVCLFVLVYEWLFVYKILRFELYTLAPGDVCCTLSAFTL